MTATTLEQSRKLLELGIDPSTADMYYPYLGDGYYGSTPIVGEGIEFSGGKDIPAWSLSALLELMPDATSMTVGTLSNGNKYYSCDAYDYGTPAHDTPIDAAFDMICKLKETNLL